MDAIEGIGNCCISRVSSMAQYQILILVLLTTKVMDGSFDGEIWIMLADRSWDLLRLLRMEFQSWNVRRGRVFNHYANL
jgi:hypothetical protein